MKTTLLFVLLAFTCTLQAQLPKLKTDNVSELRQIADTFALNAKRPYIYKSDKYDKDQGMYKYHYVNKEDTTMTLSIYFNASIVGSNQALEIEGTKEYRFYTALGRYLDLFPYWKKYIDQNADLTKCSTTDSYKIIKGKSFYLKNYSGDTWRLSTN